MKILIYKRTHKGDPNSDGIFGCNGCMGKVRSWSYDAVIGIGGSVPRKGHADIKHKINWVGLNPKKTFCPQHGNMVVFRHFKLYEENGKNIKDHYPNLFEHMYRVNRRLCTSPSLPKNVLKEVETIINSIKNSPPSKKYNVVKNVMIFSKNSGCRKSKKTQKC